MARKNILFIMCDQLRADYVGYSGSGHVDTPNIDALAEGASWSNCLSANPLCLPARSALLTGRYTHQTGTLANSGNLSPCFPTYPQALQKAGYHTAAAGKLHLCHNWQAERGSRQQGHNLLALREEAMKFGFDELWEVSGKDLILHNFCEYAAHLQRKGLLDAYLDDLFARGVYRSYDKEQGQPFALGDEDYVDNLIADRALEMLSRRPKNRPFFLFASFCGPHPPYDAPQSYLDQVPYEEEDDFVLREGQAIPPEEKKRLCRKRRSYKAMIKLLDDQVGRLMGALSDEGVLDETVVLFTADHGEMLGDLAMSGKARPWRPSLVVPAAVRHPGHLRRTRCEAPIELTDFAATVLDIAGLNPQEALGRAWPQFYDRIPAKSLMPMVRGETPRIREFAFAEASSWQAVQSDRWKYVRYLPKTLAEKAKEELYDVREDPQDLHDRSGEPGCREALDRCRAQREQVMDWTPPCPTWWAPTMAQKQDRHPCLSRE